MSMTVALDVLRMMIGEPEIARSIVEDPSTLDAWDLSDEERRLLALDAALLAPEVMAYGMPGDGWRFHVADAALAVGLDPASFGVVSPRDPASGQATGRRQYKSL